MNRLVIQIRPHPPSEPATILRRFDSVSVAQVAGRTEAATNAGTAQTEPDVWTVFRLDELTVKADVPATRRFTRSGLFAFITLSEARRVYDRCLDLIPLQELELLSARRPWNKHVLSVASHGLVRQKLGTILQCDPLSLVREISACGRPTFRQASDCGWDFNISYSRTHALFGITHGGRIGVDIQEIVNELPTQELLELTLTPTEIERYLENVIAKRQRRFTTWWVQKEAIYKSRCAGDCFEPSVIPAKTDHCDLLGQTDGDFQLWLQENGSLACCISCGNT